MKNILSIKEQSQYNYEISSIGNSQISNVGNQEKGLLDTEALTSSVGMGSMMLRWLALNQAPIVGRIG